jgi:hypothetical protein
MPESESLMWATETLQLCRSLVMSAADIWERWIWSENIWCENIWSGDFQLTNDQELPDIQDARPLSLPNTTEVFQILPATSQNTTDPQNGSSGWGSVYDAHPLRRPNTTRVLEILPATTQDMADTISCRLSVISLDPPFWPRAHNLLFVDYALDYRAVSYEWGDPSITHDIIIDGNPFPIRANLWNFLSQARREGFSRALWIDAICINQKDIEERSSQVAIMGLIYSKAMDVRAWVGLGTERHYLAFQHIAEIDWQVEVIEVQQVEHGQQSRAIERRLDSVSIVLHLEYWSRLWIIQEYALARSVTIQCGPQVLPGVTLDHLANVVGLLNKARSRSYGSSLFHSAGVRVLLSRRFYTGKSRLAIPAGLYLCILIIESQGAKANYTDLHDQVYALLSLNSIARSEIKPDYRKPLLQLFLEVILFLDGESETDPESISFMTQATVMMQKRLSLHDCAEATQARLRLKAYLESDNRRLYRRITRVIAQVLQRDVRGDLPILSCQFC